MSGPHKLSTLLGSAQALRDVRPPARSLDDLDRYLREIAPLIAFDGAGKPTFWFVTLKRWKWRLDDARQNGLSYEQAEQYWNASMEREQDEMNGWINAGAKTAARAQRERDETRTRYSRRKRETPIDDSTADELFGYAEERGII